jgi:hypothetical protein
MYVFEALKQKFEHAVGLGVPSSAAIQGRLRARKANTARFRTTGKFRTIQFCR